MFKRRTRLSSFWSKTVKRCLWVCKASRKDFAVLDRFTFIACQECVFSTVNFRHVRYSASEIGAVGLVHEAWNVLLLIFTLEETRILAMYSNLSHGWDVYISWRGFLFPLLLIPVFPHDSAPSWFDTHACLQLFFFAERAFLLHQCTI